MSRIIRFFSINRESSEISPPLATTQFQIRASGQRIQTIIWDAYVYPRQTFSQLALEYKKKQELDQGLYHSWKHYSTYRYPSTRGRHCRCHLLPEEPCVLSHTSPHLKKTLYVQEVQSESIDAHCRQALLLKKEQVYANDSP